MNSKYDAYIGKKLKDVAPTMDFNKKGIVIFLLQDKNDTIGKRVMNDFSLTLALLKDKTLANKKVVQAYDFYGESIFRVI